jgi:hypothetical protein
MKNTLPLLLTLISINTAFALTPEQKLTVKTYAQQQGITNLQQLRDVLNNAPQTGTTTNTINVPREQWEKQLITGFKTVCTAAGITFADLAKAGTVRTKLAAYAQGLTAANREEFQVITAPLFWIAYDRFRSQDPATIDADNITYQTQTPIYGTAPRVTLGLPELTNDDCEAALK